MKSVGKYQILEDLGSSAAGKTYRVRDTLCEFALKVLDSSSTVTAESKDEFCRDLAACALLQHPRLVKTHDVGEADGVVYIATNLLAGADLRTQLDEHRAIPLARKLELMAQVCAGLAAAHSKESRTATSSRVTSLWPAPMRTFWISVPDDGFA